MKSTVEAVAELIRASFPELEKRAFAVTDAVFGKENMPTLPICMVACVGETAETSSKGPSRLLITEDIVAEFWLPLKRYKTEGGGESPFYAYQDYGKIRDVLLTALHYWSSPNGVKVYYKSLEIEVTDYALCAGFRLRTEWHWCPDPITELATAVLATCVSYDTYRGEGSAKPERECITS